MIKDINAGTSGGYLTVSNSGYTPYISANSNNPMTGMIRLNGQTYEVFDGNSWIQFGSYSGISLNQSAISALDWCQRKMIEEAKIKELAAKNPTVADAFAAYNDAKSKLEMVLTLTDKDPNSL
jgi:hypothetical protein